MARDGAAPALPEGATLVKQFRSKKNLVALVDFGGERLVLKQYAPDRLEAMATELRTLDEASRRGLGVPKVAKRENGRIWLIPSGEDTMYDLAAGMAGDAEKRLEMARCARWLRSFHEAFANEGLIHGDATMGNFLLGPDVVAIDFEESRKGRPEEDAGMLVAHALASFSDKPLLALALSQGVLEGYGAGKLDERAMNAATVSGLEHLAKFREDGERLLAMARMMRA